MSVRRPIMSQIPIGQRSRLRAVRISPATVITDEKAPGGPRLPRSQITRRMPLDRDWIGLGNLVHGTGLTVFLACFHACMERCGGRAGCLMSWMASSFTPCSMCSQTASSDSHVEQCPNYTALDSRDSESTQCVCPPAGRGPEAGPGAEIMSAPLLGPIVGERPTASATVTAGSSLDGGDGPVDHPPHHVRDERVPSKQAGQLRCRRGRYI